MGDAAPAEPGSVTVAIPVVVEDATGTPTVITVTVVVAAR